MPEAHAHDLYALGEGLLRILDKLNDPRVVIEGSVLAASQQQGVDLVERGVGGRVVDDVVGGDGDACLREGLGRCGGGEQGREDAAVGLVAGLGLWLGGVVFEHGEAEGAGCGAHDCGLCCQRGLRFVSKM